MTQRTGFIVSCVVLAALITLGCGARKGPDRVVVQGNVTYEGQPVANGQIYFGATENSPAPVSGGPIKDGHYVAKARGGVPVGERRVEILGYRPAQGAANPALSEGAPPDQYIPEQFNKRTKLTAVIKPDDDPMTLDFELTDK
jgi:hypothetical protein